MRTTCRLCDCDVSETIVYSLIAWFNSVDHVKEWIASDLEKHEKCNVDDMLAYFLRQCLHGQTPASKDTSSTFLQPYLEAVLPICNNVKITSQLKK